MANKKRKEVTEEKITGLKYFDQLLPLFASLHDVGCERDKAGNRQLHMDQYCSLILLFLFNPIVTSIRGLKQASELKKVQRKLGCQRASLGSLSEATQVFEPERLQAIVEQLLGEIEVLPHDARCRAANFAAARSVVISPASFFPCHIPKPRSHVPTQKITPIP